MSRWSPRPAPDEPDGLILFDGVCVLCSRWVRFVIARDAERRHRFIPIQSPGGRELAARYGIDPDEPQTNAVIHAGRIWMKSDAALTVLSGLPGWGWVKVLKWAPRWLRDGAYDLIAGNRYRVFGQTETCMVPASEDRERFLS